MTLSVVQPSEYVEEIDLGLHLHTLPAFIDDKNKFVYCISENRIIVYNARNGKRLHILTFTDQHLAVYANEQYCVSVAASGVLLRWDLQTQSVLQADNIVPEKLSFVYNIPEGFYCVAVNKAGTTVYKLVLDNNGGIKQCNKLGCFKKQVINRKHIAICDDFAVIITGKINLEVKSLNPEIKEMKHVCRNTFPNLVKQSLLAFDSIFLVDDILYASLNIGRLLFWKSFRKDQFKPENFSSFHRHPSKSAFVMTNKEVLYAGGGEANVTKWNLAATGNGRWQKPDNSEKFDAPVDCVSLSKDGSLLVVQLEDNTVWVLQTTSMNILCELQSMQWHADYNWLPFTHDPTRPDLVLTGGRIGHVQWFDPTKWRTVAFFDVSDETTPPRDNSLYGLSYDWLNVYLVGVSPTTIVTIEKRRNRKDESSYIKFFRRNPKKSLADVVLEDTIEWTTKGAKLMSSNDDLTTEEAFASLQEEEIVLIDESGLMTVFIRDVNRSGRWLQDLARTNQWMGTKVLSASKVRRNCFAAVHKNEVSCCNHIVVWNLVNLSVYRIVDEIDNPQQIEWAPLSAKESDSVLIISSNSCVVALDLVKQCILWGAMTPAPSLSIFSTASVLCCYRKSKAFILDPLTGDVQKEVTFEKNVKEAIVATSGNNMRFVGLANKSIHLLKTESADNETDKDIEVKKTPFAELIIQNQEQESQMKQLKTFKNISIKSKFDSPIYAFPPMTRFAPELIQECLIPREQDF